MPNPRAAGFPATNAGTSLIDCELDSELMGDLRALVRRLVSSLGSVLLATWRALLARLSGSEEGLIGSLSRSDP